MDKIQILKEYFGHDSFRSGQEEIIDNILSGRDVLGIMPTGAGKSVCYQVPAMLMDGVTIVVSPLISLMKDQVSSLNEAGIPAGCINSMLSPQEYSDFFRKAGKNEYKLIYAAPERLSADDFLSLSARIKISMLTVDEAHCISHWGQDFRPSYLKIAEYISALPYRPVISAFTATATKEVKEDISVILGLKDPYVLTTGFDRKNLYFSVIKPDNKYEQLKKLLTGYKGKSGVVYCLSRKSVEEVCLKLREEGFSATRYHAGLTNDERQRNQDDFIFDRCRIMVATNAFGMGIDKSNVSFVIHYNMPKNIESYYQEAGRAGRDGEPADCILLYSARDVHTNKFMIENSREDSDFSPDIQEEIKKKELERLKYMTYYCSLTECLRKYMLKYFGDNAPDYCGNCSCCLSGYEDVDISLDSRKIISCVYRVHQQGRDYGKSMIIDILRGSRNEKILKMGFDKISTYGIMSDVSNKKLRSELDFLVDRGYLILTDDEYPVLRFSAKSAAVLKGQETVVMKLPKEMPEIKKSVSQTRYMPDEVLFEKLRELRNRLASASHVPAYIIFPDSTLRDMCRKLPVTYMQILKVSGVGKVKAEKYGEQFCDLIDRHIHEQK